MGSEDADLMEEGVGGGDGGGVSFGGSSVSCSICFEAVIDDGSRSRAKLQCGHEFHLDCIGSAFNVKGMMQCPNCRKIEKGQWLYANGSRSFSSYPEFDEWTHDEDLYDLSYSELPFHWCPFGGLTGYPSFDEGESRATVYHELLGHHTIFAEHAAVSSASQSCPYFAYLQPLQPSSSNSNEGVLDVPNFSSHHWNGLSGSNEISTSHTFAAMDPHHNIWEYPPPAFSRTSNRFGGADQASVSSGTVRSTRMDSDGQPRSGSFMHPIFLGHGSGPRTGSSMVSPLVPSYPGSNSRTHDRAPGLTAYHQQQQQQQQQQPPNTSGMRSSLFPNVRRSGGPRVPLAPVVSSSERHNSGGGFYVFPSSGSSSRNGQEADNSGRNHLYAWERDRFAPFPLIPVDRESSWWGPFHQSTGGSDSGNRSGGSWQRQGSERASQGRPENPTFQASHPPGPMHRFI